MSWMRWLRPRLLVVLVFSAWCQASGNDNEWDDNDSSKGLKVISRGGDDVVESFVRNTLPARHAVAVAFVGKGTKRHQLLEDIAHDADLFELIVIGTQFRSGNTSLRVHREGDDDPEPYNGRWTRTSLLTWLMDAAYPLVAPLNTEFQQLKYVSRNPFGVVLVVQPLGGIPGWLEKTLRPHAEAYRSQLKFTMFANTYGTQEICDNFGIWGNDELLLVEKPNEVKEREHANIPLAPKYRLEGLTRERVEEFFQRYANKTWPRYYKPSTGLPPSQPVIHNGIRELTAWDFDDATWKTSSSVFVAFVSQNCSACDHFKESFAELAKLVQSLREKDKDSLYHDLTLAIIDQTANEHSEKVGGTPWMRYWPRVRQRPAHSAQRRKKSKDHQERRPIDFTWSRSGMLDTMYSFLEDQFEEERKIIEEDGDEETVLKDIADEKAKAKAKKKATDAPEAAKEKKQTKGGKGKSKAEIKAKADSEASNGNSGGSTCARKAAYEDSEPVGPDLGLGPVGCIGGSCCQDGDDECPKNLETSTSRPTTRTLDLSDKLRSSSRGSPT